MKKVLVPFLILFLMGVATVIVILIAKGYQFGIISGKPAISGTGLLVATSNPDGAQVFVNGHLTTATNNTINLFPGTYDIKIFKDGYFPWQKKMTVAKEVVAKATATLFPIAPKLDSITQTGVISPAIDPTDTKLAYTVASQSAKKNGVYILDMNNRSILSLQSGASQIVDDTTDTFSKATLAWSPDGKSILATISVPGRITSYLLDTTTMNNSPKDVTETLSQVQSEWNTLQTSKNQAQLTTLKPELRTLITTNFSILAWSPDETKILYIASASAILPKVIVPDLLGTNSTPQERTLVQGQVYVYDIKEDRNYKILDSIQPQSPKSQMPLFWYADSLHLTYVHNNQISLEEYDAQNPTIVYAGPFMDTFVFPWPTADKIVILTNLNNPDITPNLYTVELK